MAFLIVAMAATTGLLAGCGLKGPLYLPPPTSTPAPASPSNTSIVPSAPTRSTTESTSAAGSGSSTSNTGVSASPVSNP